MIPQFKENLAWAAGFFEGEGHVGFTRTKHVLKNGDKFVAVRALLVQTDMQPLERFHDIVSVGWIHQKKIYNNVSKKPQFQWEVQSYEGVQHIMCLFWNHLSLRRREQFLIALKARKETWQ